MKFNTMMSAAAIAMMGFVGTAMANSHEPGVPQGNAFGKNGCVNLNGQTTGDTPGKYFQAQADARTDGSMAGILGGDGWLRNSNLGEDNPNVVADWIARDCSSSPD